MSQSCFKAQKSRITKTIMEDLRDSPILDRITKGTIEIESRLSHWEILWENGLLTREEVKGLREYAFELLWMNYGERTTA